MIERLDVILGKLFQALSIPGFYVPAESEPERLLAAHLVAYTPGRQWLPQVPVLTPWCRFWLDMATEMGTGGRIAIECDGDLYRQDCLRELVRDSLILQTKKVGRIYHVRGRDVRYRWIDLAYVLGLAEPGLFPPGICEAIFGLERAVRSGGLAIDRRGCRIRYGELSMAGVQDVLRLAAGSSARSFPALVEQARERLILESPPCPSCP